MLGRYRLDTFLRGHKGTLILRCVLSPFFIGNRRYLKKPRSVRLRKAMEELGPIYVKFGQLLSTGRDFLPDDLADELQTLQDNVPPFESPSIEKILSEELDEETQQIFSKVESKPFASASVAQVHNATLKNGDKVVIKVIRPDIEKTIQKDLKLLRGIASLIQILSPTGRRLRLIEIVDDYETVIFHELDLRSEAANTSQLARNFDSSQELYIPKVYWDFTRKNILVTEKIHGIQVSNIEELKRQKIDLKILAETGVNIFFTQVFEHNFFHADMHPGNIFVSKINVTQPSYIAIDCAIVGSLSRDDQYNLARMLQATLKQDYYKLSELFIGAGWVSSQTNKADLEQTLRATCEPIFEKPLSEIEFGNLLLYLFDSTRQFGLSVQPSLILLQKTLIHIEGMGREIYADLDFWGLAEPYLDQWIDKQFSPLKLKEFLEENHYEILDKATSLPGEIFDLLDNIKFIANDGIKNTDLIKSLEASLQNQRKWQNLTILTLIGIIMILMGTMLA